MLCAVVVRMLVQGQFVNAAIGLVGAILMFFGSKLGREFLGIAV